MALHGDFRNSSSIITRGVLNSGQNIGPVIKADFDSKRNHQLRLSYWQSGSREVLSFKHRAEAAALLPAEDGALLDWHEAPFKAGMRL